MSKLVELIIAGEDDYLELGLFNKILIDSGGSINDMSVPELQKRMLQFIMSDYYAVFFEAEGIRVGYALVTKDRNPMFIRHFLVLPQYRRKGYGLMAFRQLLSLFDVKNVNLTVLSQNKIGQLFWQHCGLKKYEILMHYRSDKQ